MIRKTDFFNNMKGQSAALFLMRLDLQGFAIPGRPDLFAQPFQKTGQYGSGILAQRVIAA